jgi:hypothetical protein
MQIKTSQTLLPSQPHEEEWNEFCRNLHTEQETTDTTLRIPLLKGKTKNNDQQNSLPKQTTQPSRKQLLLFFPSIFHHSANSHRWCMTAAMKTFVVRNEKNHPGYPAYSPSLYQLNYPKAIGLIACHAHPVFLK